ncbi:DUF4429 domain-containing protein [Streptosporangium sp. 'caverna']|uniref:DUF4429 domain-containing protein n=1 Tax=Streptosporangium sp. 'caverna' TaxID=2202249 RepID=UPI000D7E94CD|nr:DUF4429 domain-containing protein [Streptosporangium sp. 'caverna']AWS48039.1 Tat pathway signal sequence domain protein [Streptosporangium sp. 'caverna']
MAEVMVRDGTWTFDGEILRIVPGRNRGVKKLRQLLGEMAVPLEAVSGIAYEPGKKGGRLRLRLREGADPFTQATRGRIAEAADPYQLTIDADRTGAAEYLVDEVRNALVIEQVPEGPSDRYLLPGPALPLTVPGGDGTATFDGEWIRIEWNWMAEEVKKSTGPQRFALKDLIGLEWIPNAGLENGHLRFHLRGSEHKMAPKHNPHCLVLWGMDKETRTTALLVTAIFVRLPHPSATSDPRLSLEAAPPPAPAGDDDPDALLRRLRELGDLHRDGVLTDEEFTVTKQALLRRF